MAFTTDFLKRLEYLFPDHPAVLLHLKKQLENLTTSTCFSGIDSPGVADAMLAHTLGDFLKLPGTIKPPTCMAGVDINADCRAELMDFVKPKHLFTDIKSFFVKDVADMISQLKSDGHSISLDALTPMILSGNAVNDRAYCVNCKKICEFPRTTICTSGPPCPDFSPFGKQKGTHGEIMTAFAAWAALMLKIQHWILIVEESDRIPPAVFHTLFDHMYKVECKKLDPTTFGWFGRRPRLWVAAFHRTFIQEVLGLN
jgi:hypothetical protein